MIRVRIHAIKVADSDGSREAPIRGAQVQQWVDKANELFASCRINFELDPIPSDPNWVPLRNSLVNRVFNFPNSNEVAEARRIAAQFPDKIVIFFRYGNGTTPTGNGFSNRIYNFIVMPGFEVSRISTGLNPDGTWNNVQNIGQLAHDIGHYLLLGPGHTFPGVSDTDTDTLEKAARYIADHGGTADALDGDLPYILDTPPEAGTRFYVRIAGLPAIGRHFCLGPELSYTISGITFRPDRHNVMGYFGCEPMHYSPMQCDIMRQTLLSRAQEGLSIDVSPEGLLGMIVYGSDGGSGYTQIFASSNMGQGSGAIAWLIGDVNGDGRAEIVQLWNNGGRLAMIVYGSDGRGGYSTIFGSGDMGAGYGAIAWLTGDVNGDGRAEIVQLWNNGGRLAMIVYGSDGRGGYSTIFGSGDMGAGYGAIAWLTGDVNGDGRAEIVQLWNNGGRLAMIVYGSDGGSGYTQIFASSNMGQGSGAIAWLIGDVNGDGRTEVIQLWNNNGRLGMIVYGSDGDQGYTTVFGSPDMGQGSGAIAWLIGDVNGDGRAEIVQLWNNGGRLAMIVYGSDGRGGYSTIFGSGDMGAGYGAIAWLTGDVNGDGRAEIVQLWNNGGRLAMIVYGSDGRGGYSTIFGSGDMGAGYGAIAWLTGDVNGDGRAEIVQLWNNS